MRGYNIRWRHGNPGIASDDSGPSAKAEYEYRKTQQWVKTARPSFVFLDETPELRSIYDHSPDDNPSSTPFQWPSLGKAKLYAASAVQQPSPASLPSPAQHGTPGISSTPGQRSNGETIPSPSHPAAPGVASYHASTKRRRFTYDSSLHGSATPDSPAQPSDPSPTWHIGWTPVEATDQAITGNTPISSGFDDYAGLENTVSQSLSRIYLETPCWPLGVSSLESILGERID